MREVTNRTGLDPLCPSRWLSSSSGKSFSPTRTTSAIHIAYNHCGARRTMDRVPERAPHLSDRYRSINHHRNYVHDLQRAIRVPRAYALENELHVRCVRRVSQQRSALHSQRIRRSIHTVRLISEPESDERVQDERRVADPRSAAGMRIQCACVRNVGGGAYTDSTAHR